MTANPLPDQTPETDALYFPNGKDATVMRNVPLMSGYAHARSLETRLRAAEHGQAQSGADVAEARDQCEWQRIRAEQAEERGKALEEAAKAFSKASWDFRGSIDKWGRIHGDVSGISAAHWQALKDFDAARRLVGERNDDSGNIGRYHNDICRGRYVREFLLSPHQTGHSASGLLAGMVRCDDRVVGRAKTMTTNAERVEGMIAQWACGSWTGMGQFIAELRALAASLDATESARLHLIDMLTSAERALERSQGAEADCAAMLRRAELAERELDEAKAMMAAIERARPALIQRAESAERLARERGAALRELVQAVDAEQASTNEGLAAQFCATARVVEALTAARRLEGKDG